MAQIDPPLRLIAMLPIDRAQLDQTSAANPPAPRIAILGVGNAGVNLADRLTVGSIGSAELLAANTDSISLNMSITARKLLLGPITARGLGTGSEPARGADAAEESQAEIEAAIDGAQIVLLCGGLGGGTGSGAMPVIAEAAKNRGALVVALCSMPFAFEGERRASQAADALHDLSRQADAVICFENDRMSELTQPRSGIHETFAAADRVLVECVYSILRLTASGGPFRISIADLAAVFARTPPVCVFGAGDAAGPNRSNEAVEAALRCPLMNRGKLLASARSVLVHIEGPSDLAFAEVQAIIQQVARHAGPEADIRFGVSLADRPDTAVTVTLLAAVTDAAVEKPRTPRELPPLSPASSDRSVPPRHPVPVEPLAIGRLAESHADAPRETAEAPGAPDADRAGELFAVDAVASVKPGSKKSRARQETLRLDVPSRGRFDKSEPTIVGGEDLDVPTFLRAKVKLR